MLTFIEALATLGLILIVSLALNRLKQSRKSLLSSRSRESRRSPRYPVHCPVTYEANKEMGQGVVLNLSREGWRIRGTLSPPVGAALSLTITVPALEQPIPIAQAVVRWSDRREFGIQLTVLDLTPAAQLSEFIQTIEAQDNARIDSTMGKGGSVEPAI